MTLPPRRDFGGTWIDVVGDIIARVSGKTIIVEQLLPDLYRRLVWLVDCPEAPMFIRLGVAPDGAMAVVAKGNDTGAALLIRPGVGCRGIGTTNGNNPIAIYHDGVQFVVLWTEMVGVLSRLPLDTFEHTTSPIPPPWTGTSQGILDLRQDGSVIYMDEGRIADVNGITLYKPNERSGVYVGQSDPPAARVALPDGGVFVALDGAVDDPHLSVAPDGRILVVGFTPAGASIAICDPPYPEPPDPVPPDPVPPDPEPEPGPEPEPPDPEPEPEPEPPYPPIGGAMQTERGWLIGPGDKALSIDANGVASFNITTLTDADLLEATPIDGDYRATVHSVAHPDRYVTADATQFAPGGNPCLAFYGAKKGDVFGPDGKPGYYQRWAFGQWASGIVTAGVDYVEQGANHGRHWKSPQLTWVKQS